MLHMWCVLGRDNSHAFIILLVGRNMLLRARTRASQGVGFIKCSRAFCIQDLSSQPQQDFSHLILRVTLLSSLEICRSMASFSSRRSSNSAPIDLRSSYPGAALSTHLSHIHGLFPLSLWRHRGLRRSQNHYLGMVVYVGEPLSRNVDSVHSQIAHRALEVETQLPNPNT